MSYAKVEKLIVGAADIKPVVEYLPSMCEVLGLILRTLKKLIIEINKKQERK
jgi:hypothetical protein